MAELLSCSSAIDAKALEMERIEETTFTIFLTTFNNRLFAQFCRKKFYHFWEDLKK